MRPDSTYPRCETSHESVPAIGLTFSEPRQAGSNVPRPTTWPATVTTLTWPLPSNGRTSSGESKFLISVGAMPTSVGWGMPTLTCLGGPRSLCVAQELADPAGPEDHRRGSECEREREGG